MHVVELAPLFGFSYILHFSLSLSMKLYYKYEHFVFYFLCYITIYAQIQKYYRKVFMLTICYTAAPTLNLNNFLYTFEHGNRST